MEDASTTPGVNPDANGFVTVNPGTGAPERVVTVAVAVVVSPRFTG